MTHNFTLTNNNIKLNILTHEIENPKAVLIHIHGLFQNFQNTDINENKSIFENKIKILEKLNIVSYAIELRGHGLSQDVNICNNTFDDYVSDIDTLVNHIKLIHPIIPIHIIGESMGGAVAIKYCLKYNNIKSIILLSPLIGVSPVISMGLNIMKNINISDPYFMFYINILRTNIVKYNNYISKYNDEDLFKAMKEFINILDYIKNNSIQFSTNIMAIHSKDDMLTNCNTTEIFINECKADNKLFIPIEGDCHNLCGEIKTRDDVYKNICEWLNKFLN